MSKAAIDVLDTCDNVRPKTDSCVATLVALGHSDDAPDQMRELLSPPAKVGRMEINRSIQIVGLLRAISAHLQSLLGVSKHFPDRGDREEFDRHVRATVASINDDILPVFEKYLAHEPDPLKTLQRYKAINNLP
jgi:hypothetical protein